MKICFVDHPAHEITRSSKFFENALSRIGDVSTFYADLMNVEKLMLDLLDSNYDLYVFFQFDHLSYPFIAKGKRVIVVPMVDGSGARPLAHWFKLKGASVFAFSNDLYLFTKFLGINSSYHQYWPEPLSKSPSELRNKVIYFWERGIFSNWNIALISRILKNYDDFELVVRTNSFMGYEAIDHRIKELNQIDRETHLNWVRKSMLFVAPRPVEGIGFTNLEALGVGTPVLSLNFQTMSEYIEVERNGFLVRNPFRFELPRYDLEKMVIPTFEYSNQKYQLSALKFNSTLKVLVDNTIELRPQKSTAVLKLLAESIDAHQSATPEHGVAFHSYLNIKNFFRR